MNFKLNWIFLIGFCSSLGAQHDTSHTKPNIVLILADDLALMDFGIYGGEASTPNIDALAKNGTMFTNFRASPMCAPSRAMLLTGYDSHRTGVPNLPLFLPPDFVSLPGYEGVLNNEVKTVATRLKQLGYRTYMAGKWHLGHTEATLPSKRGFDRTFILDASGADNYEHRPYLPVQPKPPWFEDGVAINLPEDFYSSRNFVDKIIEYMDADERKEAPFFTFLSFQAIHIPVQAPRSFIEKYEGVYDGGWDELRATRFEKAKELGLIAESAKLGDMLPVLNQWNELSDEVKKYNSKKMAVNAAMMEAMDFHIGRYLAYLKKEGLLENTVFIITSDNGPEASDPSMVAGMDFWLKRVGYSKDVETIGEKGSYAFIGTEFASAAASPSAFFKFYAGEGGLRVPLIFSGANLPKGKLATGFSFITDVTPTIIDIANGIEEPEWDGRSLLPMIEDSVQMIYGSDEVVAMEAASQAVLYKGDYKITRCGKPFGDAQWRLFNLKNDPGETTDLKLEMPSKFEELMNDYSNYKEQYNVLDMPEDYEPLKEMTYKYIRNFRDKAIPWLIVILSVLAFFLIRKRRKRLLS